jgi:two-component system KDP operon response regulator KdpE
MADSRPRVLIVDDEAPIRRFLKASLQAHGYAVYEAERGEEALVSVQTQRPDVVILDLGLPDLEGTEVTRRLRTWSAVPIIILSVREEEADKVGALDAGADDYLAKPFGVGELLARVRAALRRSGPADSRATFITGELQVDLTRRAVRVGTQQLQLTPTEYDLLKALVAHAGKVLTHRQLLRLVWGAAYQEDIHLLRVHMSNLRSKLEPDPMRPCYLVTEPGVGYRLKTDA